MSVRRHASSVEKIGRRLVTATQSSPENNLDSDDSIRKGKSGNNPVMTQMHNDDECPSLDSVCMSLISNPPSSGGLALLSSLHASLPPSDNGSSFNLTNMSRPISNPPSSVPPSLALLTIDESDEDMMSSEDERESPVHAFKRGSLERSPSKSQRLKNFKGLRIDLVAAKNRMRSQCKSLPDQRNTKVTDCHVNTETREEKNLKQSISDDEEEEKGDSYRTSNDSESDYYPSDFEFELEESMKEAENRIEELEEGFPSDFEDELERGIQEAEKKIRELRDNGIKKTVTIDTKVHADLEGNIQEAENKMKETRGNYLTKPVAIDTKCDPSCPSKGETLVEDLKMSTDDEEEELFQEISDQISSTLSDEEEAFDNLSLSMDITENLTDDEDIFDKLSMGIQIKKQFSENMERHNKSSESKCETSPVNVGHPNEENENAGAEDINKARKGISFWEEKLATPRISFKKDPSSKFEEGRAAHKVMVSQLTCQLPKPTARKTKVAEPIPYDNGNKAVQEPSKTAVKEENTKEPDEEAAAHKAQNAPDDDPEEQRFERFTRQRSTVRRSKRLNTSSNVVFASATETGDTTAATPSAPVPRKRESLAKRDDPLNSPKALKMPGKDDKDELARKISESLEMRLKVNPYVDIKTWEERRKEPGRKLPQKELLGWF